MDTNANAATPTAAILSIPYRPHTLGALLLGLLLLTMLTALILLVGLIGLNGITWGLGFLLVLVAALYVGLFLHPSQLQLTPSSLRIPTGLLFRSYRRIALLEIRQVRIEGPERAGEHFALEEEAVIELAAGQVVLTKSRCVSAQDYDRLVATLSTARAATPTVAAAADDAQAFPSAAATQVIAYRLPVAAGAPPAAARAITIEGDRLTCPTGAAATDVLTIALADLSHFAMDGDGDRSLDRHHQVARIEFTTAGRTEVLERRCCVDPREFAAVVGFFLRY